tara:strand:- start:282 stop:434 length:153 start_codon:yes stop_codon:yes gene_type:complete
MLTIPEKHQLKIAKRSLEFNEKYIVIAGGPNKKEAREIIKRLEAKNKKSV